MDAEVFSVRLLLDADPVEVGDALAKALLLGQPPNLRGWPSPGLCAAGGLPLPWPTSPEWEEATARLSVQMQPEAVLESSKGFADFSFSLGLRPLGPDDSIAALQQLHGYRVSLKSGQTSEYVTTENHANPPAERQFHTCISSSTISDGINNISPFPVNLGKKWTPLVASDAPLSPAAQNLWTSWIATRCEVRATSSRKRTEVVRQLLLGSPLQETALLHASESRQHGAGHVLHLVSYMLEMETRAWLQCLGFLLVEVWRGARCTQEWAAEANLLTIASYVFAVGHAAASDKEREAGPSFDAELARQLMDELPKDLRTAKDEELPIQFTEGNVQIESFACLLHRVCSRADEKADIFRRFVDLGSGPGLAVLTAHLLFPFRGCTGCEIQTEAVRASRELARKYCKSALRSSARSSASAGELFVAGDFLEDLDWSDASVVFANAVTWPKGLIRSVGTQALRLQRGAVLLLAARRLPIELEFVQAFDVRGEAVLMDFAPDAIGMWAYQRI